LNVGLALGEYFRAHYYRPNFIPPCEVNAMRILLASLLSLSFAAAARAETRGGPISPDGRVLITAYLPLNQRMFNRGGSDGAGLCVYTSVTMAARYQREERLLGLREYSEKRAGGSWPEKLARDIETVAPGVPWLNYEGSSFEVVKAALASERMASISIPGHMLNVVYADDRWVCLLDNNDIYDRSTKRDSKLIWLTPAEFRRKWTGWAVVLLKPAELATHDRYYYDSQTAESWIAPLLTWSMAPSNPTQAFLARDGRDLGGYDFEAKIWRDYSGGKWGPAVPSAPPPWPREQLLESRQLSCVDFGCNFSRAPGMTETFSVNGRQVSRTVGMDYLQCPCPTPSPSPRQPKPKTPSAPSPTLPDDGGRLHLTVIGDAQHLVARDLAGSPQLAGWSARLIFAEYAEGDPALNQLGLPSSGLHVLVQMPNAGQFTGKIVANYVTYAGPGALAAALLSFDPKGPAPTPTPVPTPVIPVQPPPEPAPAPPVKQPSLPGEEPAPPTPAAASAGDDELTSVLALISTLAAAIGGTISTHFVTKQA
jgi:hypothetical protein